MEFTLDNMEFTLDIITSVLQVQLFELNVVFFIPLQLFPSELIKIF